MDNLPSVIYINYQLVAMSSCVGLDAAKPPVSHTRQVPRELSTVVPLGNRQISCTHNIWPKHLTSRLPSPNKDNLQMKIPYCA